MKKTIVVTTDFTASSRNALAYACQLTNGRAYKLLLVHVYTVPVGFTSDGVAIAAVRDAFDTAEERINDEAAWVNETYRETEIEVRVLIGGLLASLTDLANEQKPELIIMGAADDYANLWEWDSELLKVLTNVPVPVLLIPRQITYKTIRNIGFACDYRNLCVPKQINVIKRLVNYTGAQLHVVHISRTKPSNEDVKNKNETLLQETLLEVQPKYYAIEDPNVIEAVAHFVKEHELDMLMVIPHKHDFWYSIFHQSHTKQLARLNNMPILALHD